MLSDCIYCYMFLFSFFIIVYSYDNPIVSGVIAKDNPEFCMPKIMVPIRSMRSASNFALLDTRTAKVMRF